MKTLLHNCIAKGRVREGDPLFSFLYFLTADILSKFFKKEEKMFSV